MSRPVLFDLDGTLVDTSRLYSASYRHAFEAELTEPPTFDEFLGRRPSSERIFLVEWYGADLGDRLHQRMLEHYEAHAESLHGVFYDGVVELVATLQARGAELAIVTGKSRRAYEITSRRVDLSAFETVVVEDDHPRAKPDPGGIQRAMERLGIDDGIYVGDTPMDAEAAASAGLQPAAALWSRGPDARARLQQHLAPDVWPLHEPADLLARL